MDSLEPYATNFQQVKHTSVSALKLEAHFILPIEK